MVGRLFRAHGEFCASHPWEVIVATLTLTACMLTLDRGGAAGAGGTVSPLARHCGSWRGGSCPVPAAGQQSAVDAEYNAADVILMTIIRCSAVLYSYYQFCNLHKLGSKYILAIAGLFTVFSSFVFSSSVINFLRSDISDLKDALFFFLLLIDLSKAALLAQLALSASSQAEVTQNIARGMSLLGPTITLDTLVEALVIGVGTLSGVPRLEVLCCFACLSVLVNYVVFMTFYPACLSLILELSRSGEGSHLGRGEALLAKALHEEDQKPNPVVQRVKIIMSVGLMIVHAHSRWSLQDGGDQDGSAAPLVGSEQHRTMTQNRTEESSLPGHLMRWMAVGAEQIVILILLAALAIKFIFFEDNQQQLAGQLRMSESQATEGGSNTTSMRDRERERPIFGIGDEAAEDKATQTVAVVEVCVNEEVEIDPEPRSLDECLEIYRSERGAAALNDEEVALLVRARHIPLYRIEAAVGDDERGVRLRRRVLTSEGLFSDTALRDLPYLDYDYSRVMNACCENVLGYVQVPVGFAGPLLLDGRKYYVPMATTEGALVASTNRGCKALLARGVNSVVEDVGMTRAPCIRFPTVRRADCAKNWLERRANFEAVKASFDSTSRFARLQEIYVGMDGPQLYVRFRATTGDAMGMNMVSKGAEMALRHVQKVFPDMEIVSLSGNYCSDKKPAAINWIKGRGKRVVCDAIIPGTVLNSVFRTNAATLVRCNKLKNMVGTSLAGSIGGNNAHAANMVTAIFIATGQDPAQNVTSSNCSTGMEICGENGDDLYMTCTMPSLEVGTIGGGTVLPGQGACLEMLGVKGAHPIQPAENAKSLARIICATVMAGELSLLAALVNSDLVRSHMRHNRSSVAVNPGLNNSSDSIGSVNHTSSKEKVANLLDIKKS